MQGRRLGGWGARGDASPLRSGPIPSWQRVYHHPPGEERWGRRGSRGRRRRGGCRGQWEDSLYREGPTPAPQTWESPPPTPGSGGTEEWQLHTREPPLMAPTRNRTLTPQDAPSPKRFAATWQTGHHFRAPHLTEEGTEAGAGPAHGPKMLTYTNSISWLLSPPQRLGSQRWCKIEKRLRTRWS